MDRSTISHPELVKWTRWGDEGRGVKIEWVTRDGHFSRYPDEIFPGTWLNLVEPGRKESLNRCIYSPSVWVLLINFPR